MARTVRNAKLDSRSARSRLATRREPYWTVVSRGCAIGYRKGAKGGTWIARFRDADGRQHYEALGGADDAVESDVAGTLAYAQAQERARAWFAVTSRNLAAGVPTGEIWTVGNALDTYLAWYEVHRKAVSRVRWVTAHLIRPALGDIPLERLNRQQIVRWHEQLANTPARVRVKPGMAVRYRDVSADPDAKRRRQSTANRVLTVLKAALTRAYQEGHVASDEAWRRVVPFRGADAPRVRYLSDVEARRLVNACEGTFRTLVTAALLSGARYGELTSLRVADFDTTAKTVHIRPATSKSGKGRHIALSDEGQTFFAGLARGRPSRDLMLAKDGPRNWRTSEQKRPMLKACAAASIDPPVSFHALRHTYASRLAMRGVPLAVIAAQLGHTDTRMVERHYGHLAPSYIAETIRTAFGTLGLVPADNVIEFGQSSA